jgi:intracellular sulfur oxidation DsrE/DsrF family protein
MKNSFNGLQFGYDIPAGEIRIVGAMHGPANLLNFDDSMWAKYKIGDYLKLNDPKTGAPATRNIFFPKRTPAGSSDPNDRAGIYHDVSIEALMARGFQMLSCHNSTEGQAMALISKNALKDPVEDVVQDLQSHSLPGVIAVPAMVAAIAMLQTEGHYAYIVAP